MQTFSDILRFNLLKNNGGVWIDATIFFAKPDPSIIQGLEEKSFESLEFLSSKHFLSYKGCSCSWSGYYIAARKNSLFINVMNEIFEKYYLTYNTYSIYFFIDAAFMICKLYGIDDNVLDKVRYIDGDMFVLLGLLNEPYNQIGYNVISRVPQKLAWNIKTNTNSETYYAKCIKKISSEEVSNQ